MSFLKKFFTSLLVALTCSVSAQEPPIVNRVMGDDGQVNVPLQFNFPFYNQSFSNSWMYDNGVISFKQPGTSGALNPGQWSAQPGNQINSKYFIAPLWADIAPKAGTTTYTTQGDATFQKYSWTNIAEYYSAWGGTPRLNSFSTTIRPDGSITTTYNQINLQTSNVFIGTVGDPSKGEYNQIGFWPYGTQLNTNIIQNWSINGTGNMCVSDPLSSPNCPGYAAAYKTQQCTINPLYDPSCPGYAEAYKTQQCSINQLYDPSCPGYAQAYFNQQCTINPLYNQSCPGYAQAYFNQQCTANPLYNAQCPGYGAAYAKQMALKSAQQDPVNNPVNDITNTSTNAGTPVTASSVAASSSTAGTTSTVGTTVQIAPGGIVIDSTSTKASVSLDAGGATISTTGSVTPSTGIPEVVAAPATTTTTTTTTTITPTDSTTRSTTTTTTSTTNVVRPVGPAVNPLALARQALNESQRVALSVADSSSKLSQALDAENVLEVTGINPILGTRQNSSTNDLKDENKEKEFIGTQQAARNNISMQESLTSQTTQNTENTKTETKETVNKNSKNNELAGGVTIASLGNGPQGFNSYTNFMIRDNVFYKPHEVYRNQQTVDNKFISRRLFGATDQLHNQMVQSQYELGK